MDLHIVMSAAGSLAIPCVCVKSKYVIYNQLSLTVFLGSKYDDKTAALISSHLIFQRIDKLLCLNHGKAVYLKDYAGCLGERRSVGLL